MNRDIKSIFYAEVWSNYIAKGGLMTEVFYWAAVIWKPPESITIHIQ